MTTKTGSGRSMLAYGGWLDDYERAKREAAARIYEEVQCQRIQRCFDRIADKIGNVVGGSLDGERMPEGTRDGHQYRWDARLRRWVSVK